MNHLQYNTASRRASWQASLRNLQQAPLTMCPDFPALAQRWNDWWAFQADCPLIIGTIPQTSEIRWDKAFDLLDQPAAWVRLRRTQVEQTHFIGEALPFVRVDIGPVALAAFLGAPLHLALREQTTWQQPILESWHDVPSMTLRSDNVWLVKTLRLMEALVEDARGDYLVCLPDLTGAVDALANLRGPERLCLDLYDHREAILRTAHQIVDAWEAAFSRMYDLVLAGGGGITQWVCCWAEVPFTVPTCDFNALIGPTDFRELCLPSLSEQARRAGRCIFHLDGPEAARHAQALAESPHITAVQYTPGAATPSALEMLPVLRMLQEHHKPLFIETPLAEVKALAQELDPRGVALRISGLNSLQQAHNLMAWRDATRFRTP